MSKTSSIVIADPYPTVRQGIKAALGRWFRVVGETESGREAVRLARRLKPDLVITDIRLLLLNGLEAARQIIEALPETRVVIFSELDDDYHITQAMSLKVGGYLHKSTPVKVLPKALRAVRGGKRAFSPGIERVLKRLSVMPDFPWRSTSGLTGEQIETLELISEALENKQIASALNLKLRTVDKRMQALMKKTETHSRVELVNFVRSRGAMVGK